ncbi:MAG: putative LPS assembly protein LptD [Candidatus Neomarinimicrobiota bacterium]
MGRTALALLWLSTLGSLALSQTADDRLRWTADVQEGTQRSGKTVHILSGNVKFWKGEMELYTDGAIYYPGSDHADLSGNVVMVRPGERLTCDSLVLLNAEDKLIARGNVVMVQGNRLLNADEFHHVKTDGPRGASFQASGGVTMEEGDRFLTARRMDSDDLAGLLDLQGDAVVREEGRELRGAHIRMVYRGEVLHRALVEDGAEATARVRAQVSAVQRDWQEFEDLLTSRTMEGDFVDDRLTALRLTGMASSIYHVVEDSLLQGVNHASGDTLRLSFDDEGRLVRIRVRGGARGRFEPQRGNSDVDTVVVYRAEEIDYDIPGEITYLDQGARVDYKENGLAAGHLEVTWQNNLMRAEEAFEDRPTLHQVGHDPMYGELMEFNLVTEIGRVVRGRTRLEDGHYHGELVYRQPGDVYYMRRSLYTTCSLDTPHFYFAARRMKMLQGDKVIAKPIILYLMDVPVLGLPFAVFPNESGGRRTGWIMPSYGTSIRDGRYLEGLGYFWVINPYLDATTWLDLFDERGIRARGRFRYNRRYQFSGQLAANAFRLVDERNIANLFTDKVSTKWSASWRHNHTIDPTQRLNVNARFVSDPGIFREHGLDRQTRLTQQAISSGSYSKSWPGTPFRFTLALQERYDLQAQGRLDTGNVIFKPPTRLGQRIEEKSRVLPRLTLGRNRSALLKPAKGAPPRWYHNFYWSFNGNLNNLQSVFWEAETLGVGADSLFWPEPGERKVENQTWARNRYSFQAQQNLLRYLTVNLNLGINQDLTPSARRARVDESTGAFLTDTASGDVLYDEELALRHTGSLSLTARTTLYGLFPVGIGSLESVRHVIKPSISYRFSPDFSRRLLGYDFGYFQTDETGETWDRFDGTRVGGTPRRESQSIGFSVSNLFQAKQVKDGEEIKTNLLTWNMSSSYNFTADSLRLAPIRSSFRSPFLQRLRVDIRMEHDFYKLEPDTSGRLHRVNELLTLPRLSFMSASTTLRLSGKRFAGYARVPEEAAAEAPADSALTDPELDGQLSFRRRVVEPAIAPDNLWEATLGLRYGLRPSLDPPARETFSLGGDFKINIGPGWKVRYTTRFDVLEQELISHDLQLYRQLHCWEFSFSWTPSGNWRGFMLRINVRDADLKDIKYESRGGQQSFLGVY